jgi:hypothetical protein
MLLPDTVRLTVATIAILGAGLVASHVPLPGDARGRLLATLTLAEISLACLIAAWPSLQLTGSISVAEWAALFGVFYRRAPHAAVPLGQEANK